MKMEWVIKGQDFRNLLKKIYDDASTAISKTEKDEEGIKSLKKICGRIVEMGKK